MVSVKCLSALLKNTGSIDTLGQLLGITKETMAAIEDYYASDEHKISHVITLWLMRDPDNPVTQLRDALNVLEKQDVAQTLVLLTSLGNLLSH